MLKLFGTASIEVSGRQVTGRAAQGHRLALLALLAVARDRAMTRDRAIALLWPESPTDRARHQLSDTLYILRTGLGVDAIVATPDDLALDPQVMTSDVGTFERLLDETDPERAVALFTGPLLDGFHLRGSIEFEGWLGAERTRLAQRYAAALEQLATAGDERQDAVTAARWWRRLANHEPYSGRVAVRLMRSLAAAGDRAGALQHARIHAALLSEEFQAAPDAEVMALAEQLRGEPTSLSADGDAAVRVGRPARVERADSERAKAKAESVVERADAPASSAVRSPAATRKGRTGRVVIAGALLVALALFGVYSGRGQSSSGSPAARSLAVLPFVNMSSDPDNAYFSDGLSEQILTALSRIEGLQVAARTSSFALRGAQLDVRTIGDTLGVDAVLEGSVRTDGTRLRVTAQLINAASGYHIWTEQYDRELKDVFAVQEEIARAIADALELRLPRSSMARRMKPTPDLATYDLYLRALYLRHLQTPDALREAVDLLDRVIEREPGFAPAYAARASAIGPRIYYRHVDIQKAISEMRAAAVRALELDPENPEAQTALGIVRLFWDWDWPGAERALRRALALSPNDPHATLILANHLAAMRRYDEAVDVRERAAELDPLNPRATYLLAVDYAAAGRLDEALAQAQRAVKLHPVSPLGLGLGPGLPVAPATIYFQMGRDREAVDDYSRIAALRGALPDEIDSLRAAFDRGGTREFWSAWLQLDVRQSGPSPDPLRMGVLTGLAGDSARACRWFEQAYAERNPGLIYIRVEVHFRHVQSYPCVLRIIEQMKFPR